jgi:ankyrin repeat protein
MLPCTVQGNTPLMMAAAKGDMEAVGPLIAARANLEAKNVPFLSFCPVSCFRRLVS